jgi:hypothetical protein
MNASGVAIASWTQTNIAAVQTVRYTPGTGWSQVETATPDGWGGHELTRSAVSDTGRSVVAWRGSQPQSLGLIFARFHEQNIGWRPAQKIADHIISGPSSQYVDDPRLCISAAGRPTVAWRQYDGTQYRIFVSSWE